MDSLRATDITTFQEHGLDNLSTRRIWESLHGPDILVIHEPETVTSRPDLPVVHARGRGSMKRALDRTITNDEDQLIIDLENDMYAQSSKKPREALWKTWCIMASAWNLPPVPLTEELIPEGRCFFQSRTIPLTTELLLSSHPRTSQFDQGQPILFPTTAHQEHHQVHSQGDGTYTVQRFLRD